MAKSKKSVKNGIVPTGVPGLDEVLGGGLPGPHLYLLQGAAGTGKTTFALQFLRAGVEKGERTLYVSLSQSKNELEQIAKSHGWSLDGIDVAELQTVDEPEAEDQTIFYASDVRLNKTREAVHEAINRIKPTRVVYDSIIEIRQISRDQYRFHREVLAFKALLEEKKIAAVFIDLPPLTGGDAELESLAHGILSLEKQLPEYGRARRRIEVQKMRGVNFFDGYHDMSITCDEGVVVFPRIVPERQAEHEERELIKSGVEALDEMLGGGMEPGTTSLVVGQSGTGKSTLASLYAFAALERGEKVALFLFEERVETFFRRCEGIGLQLRKYAEKGDLRIFDFNPMAISQGEFSQIVQGVVDEMENSVVVIDSFTGYIAALPNPEQAIMQIQTLLKYLSRRGVLTILIVAQHGLLGHNMETNVDVSFLGDTVVFLRMYEWPAVIRRTLSVVKKRHGPHELDVRELTISQEGFVITEFNQPPPGDTSPVSR